MPEYLLPDVGEGLTEAELTSWQVAVGDTVAVNDIVCEIETAKSVVELPSPFAGQVAALLVQVGKTVAVGTPIITIDLQIDLSNPAASGSGEGESLVGRMKADRGLARRPRKVSAGVSQVVEADRAPAPLSPAASRVLAKPPVRKLAKDLGVDLTGLVGTGPDGTVSRGDVELAGQGFRAASGARVSEVSGVSGPLVPRGTSTTDRSTSINVRETREPVKGVRKMMAGAMTASAFSAPHVTEWVTIDVTRTVEFVERLRSRREFGEVKVSPLLVLARATMLAMRRTPIVNSTWDDAGGEVVTKHYVNLGIAVATPRGLVVPNVKNAHELTLLDLATALAELTAVAREGRSQPAAMADGTFTITNVGVFGVDSGTPIINPGESAILAFGAIRKQPWVVTEGDVDQIAIRQVTTLALSFDHRHIDGAAGSRYLADVAGILEDPAAALLY